MNVLMNDVDMQACIATIYMLGQMGKQNLRFILGGVILIFLKCLFVHLIVLISFSVKFDTFGSARNQRTF